MKPRAVTLLLLLSRSELSSQNSLTLDASPCDQFPNEGLHIIADDTSCNCFWECFNGQSHHSCCQHCFVFDTAGSYCMDRNDPDFGGCGDRPEDENCDPTPKPPPCLYPDGYFKDDRTCDHYFVCHNDIPHTEQCQMNESQQFLYNSEDVVCDFPEKVDCGSRPVCQTVEGDGDDMTYKHCQCQGAKTLPPADFKCPAVAEIGIFGDPFNCQKFYVCVYGEMAETGICEDNTYWDEYEADCVADGKCRGRPVCQDIAESEKCFCTQE